MQVIKELLRSKKFVTSIIATVVAVLGTFGFHVDEASLAMVLSPFLAFIVGQGIADTGKEKAKTEEKIKKGEPV